MEDERLPVPVDNPARLDVALQPISMETVTVSFAVTVTVSGHPYSCLCLRSSSWPRTLAALDDVSVVSRARARVSWNIEEMTGTYPTLRRARRMIPRMIYKRPTSMCLVSRTQKNERRVKP